MLSSLHLPPDIPPAYGAGRLTAAERANVLALIERRVNERLPVAYLVGETWFAGLKFKSDRRAPRSEEHTSELQSLMRTSYDVICLNKKDIERTRSYNKINNDN